jgi:predicted metal-binding protein
MIKSYKTPWEIGSLFICTKCGAKFNQPQLAEELKSELRKELKANEQQSKIRVMTSGCLNVCYPEEQTFAFMPINGETETYTTQLDKKIAHEDIGSIIKKKINS